jgi:hypothetical protein
VVGNSGNEFWCGRLSQLQPEIYKHFCSRRKNIKVLSRGSLVISWNGKMIRISGKMIRISLITSREILYTVGCLTAFGVGSRIAG